MSRTAGRYDADQLQRLSDTTIAYYDRFARAFWEGTRHHDVSQNYAALLNAIEGEPPFSILDLGCGPGRDLSHFRSLGHEAVGLDGSRHFVAMARSHSQCEVFHQDFLAMQLPENRFDGIFAKRVAVPSAQPGIAEGSAATAQNVEAARCAVLLQSEGEQRGGVERRSLCLFL